MTVTDKDREIIYRGKRVTLEVFKTVLPNGHSMTVERILFPRAVAAVPVINNDVILIRQYRPVLSEYIVEVPAGVVEPNERPEDALIRELREEVGGIVDKYELMFQGYTSPGYSTEYLYIYLAALKELTENKPETHEVISIMRVNINDALKMVFNGEIRDHKTAFALLLYAYKRGLRINP